MKRSASVSLGLIAMLVALTGCGDDEKEDRRSYTSVADCQADEADNELSDAECKAYFDDARADHEKTAPRFTSSDYCQNFSGGSCTSVSRNGETFWVPAMAGFALGASAGMLAGMPFYQSRPQGCDGNDPRSRADPRCSANGSLYSHGAYVGTYSSYSSGRTYVSAPRSSPFSSSYGGSRPFTSSVTSSAKPVTATSAGRPTSGWTSSGAPRAGGFGSGSSVSRGGFGTSAAGHAGGGGGGE